MMFELSPALERGLRPYAQQSGRDVRSLIADAVCQYRGVASLADLAPADIAAAQRDLAGFLDWQAPSLYRWDD